MSAATGPKPGLATGPGLGRTTSGRLVIVGCSAKKTHTTVPLPAIDLYDGGCVPPLRERLAGRANLRARVRFLSGQHGLITADTPLRPYDRRLDAARAVELRPAVATALAAEEPLDEVLVVAEPLYLVPLADLLTRPRRPRIHWIPDHAHGWPQAAAVLDDWGW